MRIASKRITPDDEPRYALAREVHRRQGWLVTQINLLSDSRSAGEESWFVRDGTTTHPKTEGYRRNRFESRRYSAFPVTQLPVRVGVRTGQDRVGSRFYRPIRVTFCPEERNLDPIKRAPVSRRTELMTQP